MSQIYFIRSGNGPIKIGLTLDPDRRLSDLQCGNPEKLTLLQTMPGNYALEARLHSHFRRINVIREWFAADAILLDLVDSLAGVAFADRADFATEFMGGQKVDRRAINAARLDGFRVGLAAAVTTVRNTKGIAACAEAAGVSQTTIRNGISGRTVLTGPTLVALMGLHREAFAEIFPESRAAELSRLMAELREAIAGMGPNEARSLLPTLRKARVELDHEIARLEPKLVASA